MARCFAYSFASSFKLNELIESLKVEYQITLFDGAIHICEIGNYEAGSTFVFPYGAIVTWGLSEKEEARMCKRMSNFLGDRLGEFDDDLFSYEYGEKTSVKDDHIVLPYKDVLTKLACSFALAQSVKLGGFEKTIQNIFEKTKVLPERMAKHGNIHLSRSAIRKLMGRIFVDRTSINLHLDLLDSPNFFWENAELEPLHKMITDYVEQKHRMTTLNQRLAVLQELLDMLATELNNQHSSKLEWIIIILIASEIILMLSKEIFNLCS